jgi:hypothetical protein
MRQINDDDSQTKGLMVGITQMSSIIGTKYIQNKHKKERNLRKMSTVIGKTETQYKPIIVE